MKFDTNQMCDYLCKEGIIASQSTYSYTTIEIEYETTPEGNIKVNLIYRAIDDYYYDDGEYYFYDNGALHLMWNNNGYSGSGSLIRVE